MQDQREEFVQLARSGSVNLSELCRRFQISRKTGYKWIERWEAEGLKGLQDQSRRPLSSPSRTAPELEQMALSVRQAHPAWGARKIAWVLRRDHGIELACSTVNSILHRHACITEEASEAAHAWHRFEHEAPNDLWQMDFKGHFAMDEQRCHPLTVIDDHSRYNIVLHAIDSESYEPVRARLQRAFERYGLPQRINTDNGAPWRAPGQEGVTRLGLWFIRLGVKLSHSRLYHPQTNGKDERFHRTFKAEVLGSRRFKGLADAQRQFDTWRHEYNFVRPHEGISMQTPSERYRPSLRRMPSTLPPIEYAPDDIVRRVQAGGWIHVHGREYRLVESLRGQTVALRPRPTEDGIFDVYFCHQQLYSVDLRQP